MTIPFWLILVILIAVGVIGFSVITGKAGDYDFFTPMLAVGFAMFFVVLAIGLALGRWIF